MISGMVDHRCLTTARDAGVNEFVAKPFSPDIVFKRIQKLIESPRQFVYTPTYFGPDRRRSKGYVEEERRKLTEADCEIVYSGKDPGKFSKDKPPVWLFRMPNRLKEKGADPDNTISELSWVSCARAVSVITNRIV